jgi:Na+(H+)/acetate symporter ActP
VKSADDVRDAIVNGHTVTIASNWGGMMGTTWCRAC